MKNSKFKKILSLFLALIIVLGTIPASVVSVGAADNAGGIATGGSSGKWNATYRKDESMWKVSVYIAKKDTTTVTNSKISDWYNISDGKEIIIYTDENEATLAESACFGKMSKIDYLSENSEIENASVEFVPLKNKNDNTYNFIEILDTSAPEVPIDGNSSTLSDVKAYFADSGTLIKLLRSIARSIAGGTSKADVLSLFADKSFTIDGYTKKGSEWEGKTDINGDKITLYPTSENGTIKSAMEFLIVYEPIVVQHFGSGITPSGGGSKYYVSCFTATELSIFRAQGSSLGDLMHLPTYVAKAVHLEKDWLGYKKSNTATKKSELKNNYYHEQTYRETKKKKSSIRSVLEFLLWAVLILGVAGMLIYLINEIIPIF